MRNVLFTFMSVALGFGALGSSCESSPTGPGVILCELPPVGPVSSIHSPSWSRDGTRIAFHSAWDSAGNLEFGWYETDTLGSYKKPMGIDGNTMRWMPGDSEIITSIGDDFARYNLNSGDTTFLGLKSSQVIFDVSNSGRFLYYTQRIPDSGKTTGIYSFEFKTGEIQ